MTCRLLTGAALVLATALGGCATYPEYGYNYYAPGYYTTGYYPRGPSYPYDPYYRGPDYYRNAYRTAAGERG